jgi:4-aminobutyrate aminotransferase-like enzyme
MGGRPMWGLPKMTSNRNRSEGDLKLSQEGLPSFLGAGDFTYRSESVPRFVAGHGSRLKDTDGRSYVDAEAANGTASLGYDAQILEEAARATAALPALPSFCESELRLRVAARLEAEVSRAVGVPGRISFEVGGAQGIELAMKIVASNRDWGPVVVFQGGYHGRSPFTGALSASARYRRPISVGVGEILRLPYPDCERCPFGLTRDACEEACVSYLRFLKTDQSGVPDDVSALLFEPVLNVGGMAVPPAGYLQAAIAQFRASGALVVVDEIFTGFHRVGPRFGFELHGVKPDIVVLSKALTNGAAGLSAVWAREPLLDPDHFPPGTHSSTFSGTPFMLSVADVVLDRFADRKAWIARVADLETALRELVAEAAEAAPAVVQSTEAHGGVARLLLREPVAWDVRTAALEPSRGSQSDSPGVLLASTGMSPDVIAVHPPLTIGAEDLAVVRDGLIRALRSLA